MKISELIEELIQIREDHGDLDVIADGTSVNAIEIDTDERNVKFVELS
jgi:hypothetical protein